MTKRKRFLPIAAIAAVALAAAACSNNDRTPAATGDAADMPPAAEETAQTPAEQLAAAEEALTDAEAAVVALTSSSTAEEAAAAYAALGTAQAAVHAATNLPANQIAALENRITTLTTNLETANTMAMQFRGVVDAVNEAQAAIDDLTDDSTDAAVDAANDLVTAAQTALTGATALDDADTARLDSQVANVESQIADIQMALDARPTPEDIAEAEAKTKAAGTKETAIGKEARQTTDDGAGGEDAATDHTITITRDSGGTEVEITVAGAAMDDPKFIDQDAGLDRGRSMHVRTMEANDDDNVVEEVVIVGTDIAAPKAVAFAKFEDADGMTPQVLNARDLDDEVNADNVGSATDDWTAKTVGADANTTPEADELKLVMSGAFVPGPGTGTVLTFARYQMDSDDTTDGDQTIAAFETAGTYNGAMGTYRCDSSTSDDCTVGLNAKGEITAMSVGWVFTPASRATSDQPDYEYLQYGFWLQRTTDEDGVLEYDEVETFASAIGHPETVDNDLGDVEDSATYEGGSVGVYVKNVLDDQANILSATSGHFSADVELRANFGGGNVAANDQFTIEGEITDFDLQHGEENDWAVKLGLTDFSGRTAGNEPGESAPGNAHDNEFSGVATGDSTAAAGSWNGSFWGSSADFDHDDDATTGEINPQPVAVIGEFNANFTDGTTAGAFGANKK